MRTKLLTSAVIVGAVVNRKSPIRISTMANDGQHLDVGDARFELECNQGNFLSLGAITVNGGKLRNPANRFVPWFDTYDGGIFNRFQNCEIKQEGNRWVIATPAIADSDYPFRERRDSSGDLCLRPEIWDAEPMRADFRIVLEPTTATLDGRHFSGFRYWFEYSSNDAPIHRLMDRQTWEIGGNLDDVILLC